MVVVEKKYLLSWKSPNVVAVLSVNSIRKLSRRTWWRLLGRNYSRWAELDILHSRLSWVGVMGTVMTYSDVKTIRSLDWLNVHCWNIHEILGFSVCFKINSWVLDLSNPVSCFQQKYFHLFLYISVLSPLNLKKVVISELFYCSAQLYCTDASPDWSPWKITNLFKWS